jgi:hypothetical protein
MGGTVRLSAEGTVNRGLSPEIWQAYGLIGTTNDPSRKPFFFDDFAGGPVLASATAQAAYKTLQEGGSLIQQYTVVDNAQEEFGVLVFDTNDADNEETHLELGGGVAGLVRLDDTAGSRSVVAWEARIRRTTVLDNELVFAVGLGEPGFAATNALVDDTGAMVAAGKDFVGFQTLAASNEEIDAIYTIGGTATVNQVKDNAGTAVAATYNKLGCVFDPLQADGEKLRYYIDGAEITYGTKVTDAVIAAGTAFPTDEEMTLVLLSKNTDGTPAEHNLFIDWWAVGSYLVDG